MGKKRRSCTSKVKHPSHEVAMIVIRKQKNIGLSAYKCRYCGGWHVGNDRDKAEARIGQLLKH